MSSKLRYSTSVSIEPAEPKHQTIHAYPPQKRQKKMSLTQSYYLAHTARGKLSAEAARGDHDLRLLVGHANLLDSLMLELAQAEKEQEQWFNQSVKGAAHATEEPRHIQWADTIIEDPEDDWDAEDADSSDSESESDEEEEEEESLAMSVPLRKVPSPPTTVVESREVDEDEDEEAIDDEDYDDDDLSLVRTSSRSPPELLHDSDDSEDESMPPSPPQVALPSFSEKHKEQVATTSFYSQDSAVEHESLLDQGFYLQSNMRTTIVGAC